MNKKILYVVSFVSMFILVLASNALAKENEDGAVSGTQEKIENREQERDEVKKEEVDDEDDRTGDQHRSEVSKVVQELQKVAEKDKEKNKELSEEIKKVAEEEDDVSEKVKEKMDKVQVRSALKTFLFGSDYKNLGALRSELVTTDNHLERLNKALERTNTTSTRTELETQIKELQAIKTKAETFVQTHENKFSLLGWLVRMFQR